MVCSRIVEQHFKNNSVDKTDGFQLYLSLESLDADIVTAKVSEVRFNLSRLEF